MVEVRYRKSFLVVMCELLITLWKLDLLKVMFTTLGVTNMEDRLNANRRHKINRDIPTIHEDVG